MKTLEQLIAQIKEEILADIRTGRQPVSVASFFELHDRVDANCYGELCDDEVADEMIEHFGGRDEHEGMPQGMLDHINMAHDAVSAWLARGGHHDELRKELWVRDGALFQISSIRKSMIQICRQGGGFNVNVYPDDFFKVYKRQDKAPTIRPFLTGLDGFESCFVAYSNGYRWNGWARPMFEEAQILEIIQLFGGSEPVLRFNYAEDVVEEYDFNEDKWCRNAAQEVEVEVSEGEFETKTLYSVGDGWTWSFHGWWADLKR